jgi:Holliday junction DNA helicase RuvB
MIESGPNARDRSNQLESFYFIGATGSGLLTAQCVLVLEYHLVCSITQELLTSIVERSAGILKMPISYEAAEIESEQRNTAYYQRFIRRVRDFTN